MAPVELSVVIMAYNEAETLESTCEELSATIRRLGCSHELLIVDDGSTDGTGELAESLAGTMPSTRVIHHRPNRGLEKLSHGLSGARASSHLLSSGWTVSGIDH
jgi:glycosyltransferase involved in cell wall biosynthesis